VRIVSVSAFKKDLAPATKQSKPIQEKIAGGDRAEKFFQQKKSLHNDSIPPLIRYLGDPGFSALVLNLKGFSVLTCTPGGKPGEKTPPTLCMIWACALSINSSQRDSISLIDHISSTTRLVNIKKHPIQSTF
jgi:hypothetical protein